VLETGFGLGNNFLATWSAWRDDPERCDRLWFISIDKHPPTREDLARAQRDSALPALATQLVAAWPPLTPNLHSLSFEDGRVRLLLAFGDIADWLPEIVADVDAFYLDGFAPACNAQMWDRRVFKALGRLAAPGATAATWSVARDVRDGLASTGFAVERAAGFGGKREMTVARYEPSFTPRRAPARALAQRGSDVLIVGAGLAGASAAWALSDEGCDCLVLDTSPLHAASGRVGGIFHGTVHAQDGIHARFNRAAALEAARLLHPAIRRGAVAGQADGLLRLQTAAVDRTPASSGLPADYAQLLSASDAAAACGWPLTHPAWFYPGGGWLDPASLKAHWLGHPRVHVRCGVAVQSLRAAGERWEALDCDGRVVAHAANVVLANAHDALRLLGGPAWPMERLRGQTTLLPRGALAPPRLPVAGAGYALGLLDGTLMCGATSQRDDDHAALRAADHRYNLERLAQLAGPLPPLDTHALDGRVGWRLAAGDRMPLVGAVPDPDAPASRLDQPRFVPRIAGLFVYTALASRGITWAALGARVLSSWIAGAPWALESSLIDAIDPARFAARNARKASS
jgi:tRNA 5-methylaminomethyl-2-thiouridine biosynthesis bifunctional protein